MDPKHAKNGKIKFKYGITLKTIGKRRNSAKNPEGNAEFAF